MAAKKNKRKSKKKKSQEAEPPDLRAAMRVAVWVGVALLVVVATRVGALTLWGMLRDAPECQVNLRGDIVLPDWPDCVMAARVERAVEKRLLERELPSPMSIVSRSDKGATPAQLVHTALEGMWWIKSLDAVRATMPSADNDWKPRIVVDATSYQSAAVVHWYNPALGGDSRQIIDRDGRWLGDELDYYKLPDAMSSARTPRIVDDRSRIPTPKLGELWNSVHFSVGARLCMFLHEGGLFDKLHVTKIDVEHVGQGSRAPVRDGSTRPDVTLHTAGGALIKWGCTDTYADVEGLRLPPDEPTDANKLERLLEAIRLNPTLAGNKHVDLRYKDTKLVSGSGTR